MCSTSPGSRLIDADLDSLTLASLPAMLTSVFDLVARDLVTVFVRLRLLGGAALVACA